jgi:hypothetical protein
MMMVLAGAVTRAAGRAADEVMLVLGSKRGDEAGMHSSLLSVFAFTESRMS